MWIKGKISFRLSQAESNSPYHSIHILQLQCIFLFIIWHTPAQFWDLYLNIVVIIVLSIGVTSAYVCDDS